MVEKASIEFTVLDESGVEISYDRQNKKLIIEGWYNYLEQMDKFEISLDDFLKSLIIPIEDIRTAYGIDCWGSKVKNPSKKKPKYKSQYKKKGPELWKWNKHKPTFDLVCQWKECGKTFNTTDKKRKYCCQECTQAMFKERMLSGEGPKEDKAKRLRQKAINQKIKDTKQRKKNNEL
jgi:hypothetical protein